MTLKRKLINNQQNIKGNVCRMKSIKSINFFFLFRFRNFFFKEDNMIQDIEAAKNKKRIKKQKKKGKVKEQKEID